MRSKLIVSCATREESITSGQSEGCPFLLRVLYTYGTWSVRRFKLYLTVVRASFVQVAGSAAGLSANGVSPSVGRCGALVGSASDLGANGSPSIVSFGNALSCRWVCIGIRWSLQRMRLYRETGDFSCHPVSALEGACLLCLFVGSHVM